MGSVHLPPLSWFQAALGLAISVATLVGLVAGSRLIVAFMPKAVLARDLLRARSERDEARTWAERLERRLSAQAVDITAVLDLVGELRREVGEMRGEIAALRKTLVVAFRHIADLVLHIKARKSADTMPPLPAEISDEVLAELRTREQAAAVESLTVAVAPGGAA